MTSWPDMIAQIGSYRAGFGALVIAALVTVVLLLLSSSRRTVKRCPRCKEINRQQAVFCAQCGARLLAR